jgi:type VI secretion system protein ImpC
MEGLNQTEMARKPLKAAEIIVKDLEGKPGWYEVEMQVTPHFKYEGAYFTLSLVGKMDNTQKK